MPLTSAAEPPSNAASTVATWPARAPDGLLKQQAPRVPDRASGSEEDASTQPCRGASARVLPSDLERKCSCVGDARFQFLGFLLRCSFLSLHPQQVQPKSVRAS
eukprot:scaffold1142_cov387-Prasinococcus_capsulatus_cf.AAC.14